MVIVDEVHERHLVVDFVLGILREVWLGTGGNGSDHPIVWLKHVETPPEIPGQEMLFLNIFDVMSSSTSSVAVTHHFKGTPGGDQPTSWAQAGAHVCHLTEGPVEISKVTGGFQWKKP